MPAMFVNRRSALAGAGVALVLTCSGGLLRATSVPDRLNDAYSPWELWDAPKLRGQPVALVAAAVLAANPHDTQPWLFHVREESIEIYADLSRNLGTMDCYLREMHLGIGCAVENACQAAGPNGYSVELHATPGSLLTLERNGPILAATLRLTRQTRTAQGALYDAIADRHTNRFPYDRRRTLPDRFRELVKQISENNGVRIFLCEDGSRRQAFEVDVLEATKAIIADRAMIADNDRWFRPRRADIARYRDGVTLEAAGLSKFRIFLARLFPVSTETAHHAWLDQTRMQVASAPLLGLIAVKDRYDRQSAIAAGRAWQRLHLGATVQGIAMQPLNQAVEMADREWRLGRMEWSTRLNRLHGGAWQATFAFRAGFASEKADPSPRRALQEVTST